MIVEIGDDHLLLHSQISHARACGTFAGVWDESTFGPVPGFVREAAATHDDGWSEWDRRPRLAPGGEAPHSFSSMPADDYREIWRLGTERGWRSGAEVGLLISLHGMRFFEHRTAPEDRRFLAEERERQREALRRLGAEGDDPRDPPTPWRVWSEWLSFWDGLSLLLCGEFESPWRKEVRTNDGVIGIAATRETSGDGCRIALHPFPFRRGFEVEISHHRIPRGPYADQAALDRAVTTAEQGWRRCAVASAAV